MFMSLISKFLSPIMPYLLGGGIIGIMILSGLLYYKSKNYDKLLTDSATKIELVNSNNKVLNSVIEEQKNTLKELIKVQEINDKNSKVRKKLLLTLQSDLNKQRNKYDRITKKWEKAANGRPTLLSRYINRAVTKRVQFFATATCRENCNSNQNKINSNKTTAKTK